MFKHPAITLELSKVLANNFLRDTFAVEQEIPLAGAYHFEEADTSAVPNAYQFVIEDLLNNVDEFDEMVTFYIYRKMEYLIAEGFARVTNFENLRLLTQDEIAKQLLEVTQ
jgi:hypothetical protein